jgi:hypothetical protein
MFQQQMHRAVHDDRIREMRARVAEAQRRDAARAWNSAQRPAPRSIRRSIGRSIVRMGQAIAAEPGSLRSENIPPVASS